MNTITKKHYDFTGLVELSSTFKNLLEEHRLQYWALEYLRGIHPMVFPLHLRENLLVFQKKFQYQIQKILILKKTLILKMNTHFSMQEVLLYLTNSLTVQTLTYGVILIPEIQHFLPSLSKTTPKLVQQKLVHPRLRNIQSSSSSH